MDTGGGSPRLEPAIRELQRAVLAAVLEFFDAEPELARSILVESLAALTQGISPRQVSRPAHRADLEARVPGVLLTPRAHRTRLCLLYVMHHPGASNQQVATGVGIPHRGQAARLLGRLVALGLLVKQAAGPGYPNAWSVTDAGARVALALVEHGDVSQLC